MLRRVESIFCQSNDTIDSSVDFSIPETANALHTIPKKSITVENVLEDSNDDHNGKES